jgi:AcrR family transcriptional regulator
VSRLTHGIGGYPLGEMADSVAEHKAGKRERLVTGARQVIHQQGVEKTTIADVARAAHVPVGNVYYYFKTKDELVGAAIESHAHEVRALLESLERHRSPQARLKALVRELTAQRELAAEYGAPWGACARSSTNAPTASTAPVPSCCAYPSTGPSSSSGRWGGAMRVISRSR